MNGLPYYPRYPRDLIEGTIGMTFEEKTTYGFILDLIYLQGGKLPDDARYIAGILSVSVRKWNSLRAALIKMGKIQVSDGFLTNYRAVIELEKLSKYQDKQRENRSRPNKSKDLRSPSMHHTEPEPDIREEPKGSLSSGDDLRRAFDAYNEAAREVGWPIAQVLSKKRKTGLAARLKDAGGMDGWMLALGKARASPLCTGDNSRGWVADLDFLLQPKSFTRLMEGSYDKRTNGAKPASGPQNGPDPALTNALRLAGVGQAQGNTGG